MPRRKQANGSPDLRPLVLHYVRTKPTTTTIAELLADTLIGSFVRELSIAELFDGTAPATAASRKSPSSPGRHVRNGATDTRTADGRSQYDERVLVAIKGAGGPASAESLLPKTGGDAAQFRAATKRLMAAKKIRRSGKARGTRYAAA